MSSTDQKVAGTFLSSWQDWEVRATPLITALEVSGRVEEVEVIIMVTFNHPFLPIPVC